VDAAMTSTMTATSDGKLGVLALSAVGLLVGTVIVWYSYQFTVCLLGDAGPNPPTGACAPNMRFSSQESSR
jgi:hypothetical protein